MRGALGVPLDRTAPEQLSAAPALRESAGAEGEPPPGAAPNAAMAKRAQAAGRVRVECKPFFDKWIEPTRTVERRELLEETEGSRNPRRNSSRRRGL